MPKTDIHVAIWEETLNSKCAGDASPLPLANGCTFLWVKPDDANTVGKLLRQSWEGMDGGTWSDFCQKNAESAHLQEPIATPWKHRLVGLKDDKKPMEWQSPELALFFSRVGFNRRKTEAVVFVLMFSYMEQVATAGDYFLFRLSKKGRWEPDGRVTYFEADKSNTAQR